MTSVDTAQAKQAIRERIWTLLEEGGAVPPGRAHGRIPNFAGAETAAARLAALPVWRAARVVKAVPDKAQLPVRARALDEHKTVYMAVPKLADEFPFYLLDPNVLDVPAAEAASSRVASHKMIACGPQRRPGGIHWEQLSREQIAAIPALATRARHGGNL